MSPTPDVDNLPPTQYLILEVLAARHRTGEQLWTFPKNLRPHLRKLEGAGLVNWKGGITADTVRAWLTDTGRASALSDTYTPPAPVDAVAVVSWDPQGQPDVERLSALVQSLPGHRLNLWRIADTGSAQCAVVFSTGPLDEERATAAFNHWLTSGCGDLFTLGSDAP